MKPKLLVVELWGLGDLVISTPFLKAACEEYAVTLLAKPYATDLQSFWPEVRVVPFVAPWTAFKHKYRLFNWPWRRIFRLRRLAHERFDIGLSARWDPRDHLLLKLVGARRRLGFPRVGSQVFLTQPLPKPASQAHRYEFWRVLGDQLGLRMPARDHLTVPQLPPRGEIMVHSGAGQPVRVWPLERYRSLVHRLRRENYRVQVVCDADQRTWWLDAQEKEVATPSSVTDLIGLIGQAGAFIGNDSGPGHLAACCGVPTFTIFGPQLPERFAPLHPEALWLPGQPCRFKPCSDSCRLPMARCLWDLSEATVWQRVQEFTAQQAVRLVPGQAPALRKAPAYSTPRPRRFIQLFCRYLMPGGEENSVARIAGHLELGGHEVVRFWRASEEWNAPSGPPFWLQLPLLWRNPAVLDELRKLHYRVQPDAWIFHNLLPVISLSTYQLAAELNVPVIHWLHNYRPLSPSGTMRAGGTTLNPEDRWLAWKEARHGTWHGRMATAALALAYRHIRRRGNLQSVKAWVAVSEEMRQIFRRAKFAPQRLFRLHHSWDIRPPLDLSLDQGYFLVLSRMVEEKGIRFIVELWQRPEFRKLELVMAGEGPLADEYRGKTPRNLRWTGFVRGEEKRRLLAGCRALLFPCLWAEPLTTVVYEAYEQGKPVLASNLGGLKELVVDKVTGRLLEPGNPGVWIDAILEHAQNPALSRELGMRGLRWLQQEVSPSAWNRQFDEILEQALERE